MVGIVFQIYFNLSKFTQCFPYLFFLFILFLFWQHLSKFTQCFPYIYIYIYFFFYVGSYWKRGSSRPSFVRVSVGVMAVLPPRQVLRLHPLDQIVPGQWPPHIRDTERLPELQGHVAQGGQGHCHQRPQTWCRARVCVMLLVASSLDTYSLCFFWK